jgi:hypothetical protein
MDNFDEFPVEMIIKIIEFLDFKAILNLLHTQKRLLLIVKEYVKLLKVDEKLSEAQLRKLCCNFGDSIVKISLEKCSNLKSKVINRNSLAVIVEILKKCPNLKELHLGGDNGLTLNDVTLNIAKHHHENLSLLNVWNVGYPGRWIGTGRQGIKGTLTITLDPLILSALDQMSQIMRLTLPNSKLYPKVCDCSIR